jgi:hypothetical protein
MVQLTIYPNEYTSQPIHVFDLYRSNMKTNIPQFHFSIGSLIYFLLVGIAILIVASLLGLPGSSIAHAANGVPRPDHVLIVIEENHDYSQIIGNSCCTYINAQAAAGALMTNSHGLTHPSEPNYLDLFSGSNQGVTDDSCPHTFSSANLGQELIAAGLAFGGYSEDMPSVGYTGCTSGSYARRHNPWVNFSNVPSADNMPWTSFPTDFTQLPAVSIVVPNLCNDMHDCSPATGDAWIQSHLDSYVQWAKTHNSLFIITFDENNGNAGNQIATIFEGPMVQVGQYSENINHFNILRTLEDMYNLPYAGQSASVASITDIWLTGGPTATPTATSIPGTLTPTPTATATPAGTVVHVANLAGSSATHSTKSWRATVTITVQNANLTAVANATVRGSFTGKGTVSCITGSNGTCSITSSNIPVATTSTTFTVSNISGSGMTYNPAANTSTSITISKP